NQTQTAQRNHGLSGQWTWRNTLAGNPSQTTVGAAYDASQVSFNQTAQLGYLNPDRTVTGVNSFADGVNGGDVDGEPYDSRVKLSGRTQVASLYAANTLTFNHFHLTTSARYNHNRISNTDLIHSGTAASLSGDHRFSRLNPSVGLTYAPSKALVAYAAYNEGSRAPSTIELGCANPDQPCKLPNAMAGDPPLKQVVTKTIEGGVRGMTDAGLTWNVGAFRAVNHDDIQFVADDQAGFGYFKNMGKTRRQGLEWGLSGKVGALKLGANLTWLDATYQSTETFNGTGNSSNSSATSGVRGIDGSITVRPGDRIPLLPRQILKLSAAYKASPTLSFGASVLSQGSMYARGNENNAHQPDGVYYLGSGKVERFTVVNVSVNYKPVPRVELFFKVDNLFNTHYKTSAQLGSTGFDKNGNFVARPFAPVAGQYPVQQATFYAPGAPRSFLLGLKYLFD
ncbi:MAG: TonB-dependent receptor, partial [Burkholderiales bacterium]|nr:TonB-dependent receptor [Burkholderiales bacterium]